MEDCTEVKEWLKQLEELYNDFQRRIRVEEWQKLLSAEVCHDEEIRSDAEYGMLRFLTEHLYLPHAVWQELNKEFAFTEHWDQLQEECIREFLEDVLLEGIRNEDAVPYDLFVPGTDAAACDAFLQQFAQAAIAKLPEEGDKIKALEQIPEYHPYKEALYLKYRIACGEKDALKDLQALSDKYPEDTYILLVLTAQYFLSVDGLWKETEQSADRALAMYPRNRAALWYRSNALAEQGKYQKAADCLEKLMEQSVADPAMSDTLDSLHQEWNEKLIAEYRKQLEENPADADVRLRLLWCLAQNEHHEERKEVQKDLPVNQPDRYEYCNYMSVLQNNEGNFEEALGYIEGALEETGKTEQLEAKVAERRKERLPLLMLRKGLILVSLNRLEEAWQVLDQAHAMDPENVYILLLYAEARMHMHDYAGAAVLVEELCDLVPDRHLPKYLMAVICYKQYQTAAALQYAEDAVNADPTQLEGHILQLVLRIRRRDYEEAHAILEFLEQKGAGEYLPVRWCKAWLGCSENIHDEEAYGAYTAIAEELKKNDSDEVWLTEFWYRYALITEHRVPEDENPDRKVLVEFVDHALAAEPEDRMSMDYKAWQLNALNRLEEAAAIYEKLVRMPHNGATVERDLARVYYKETAKHADQALQLYERAIAIDEQADDHFYAGMCAFSVGDLEGAEKHFLREQELDPEDPDGFSRLSYIYQVTGRLAEAEEQADKAVRIVKDLKGWDPAGYFLQKARVLRKEGKLQEAVQVIQEAMDRYSRFKGHPYLVEAYEQFGDWSGAEAAIRLWHKSTPGVLGNPYESERCAALVKDQILQKKWVKARFSYINYKDAMKPEAAEELKMLLASAKGSIAEYENYTRREKEALKTTGDDDYPGALLSYADALWLSGWHDEAKLYAQEALDLLDEIVTEYRRNQILFHCQRMDALWLLGRDEEAEQEWQKTARMPMCEMCCCEHCKDRAIFRIRGLIYQKKTQEALQVAQEYQKKWPDETDFIFYENILKAEKKN